MSSLLGQSERFTSNTTVLQVVHMQDVNCDKRFSIGRHRNSVKHEKLQESGKKKQTTLLCPTSEMNFGEQLVDAWMSADIPLYKLRNEPIVKLFNNLCQPVPSESSCRSIVEKMADGEMHRIREVLKDKKVFIVIDESEVSRKKYVKVLVDDI